jgi:hypothetical protein
LILRRFDVAKTIPASTVVASPPAPAAPPQVIGDDPVNRHASTEAMKLRLQKLDLGDEILAMCMLADGKLAGGSLVACAAILAAAGQFNPAVAVLAQGLSGRGAAWWACRAARLEPPDGPSPKELPALEAAERWVRDPVSAHAHAAHAAAKQAGFGTPAGCAAIAAFMAGDTIAPPHLPPLSPPPNGPGLAAAGAVRLAAARRQPVDPDALARLLTLGQEVAAGSDSWRPADGQEKSNGGTAADGR